MPAEKSARVIGVPADFPVSSRTAVAPQRLGDFAGRLSPGELMRVNVALRAVLELE